MASNLVAGGQSWVLRFMMDRASLVSLNCRELKLVPERAQSTKGARFDLPIVETLLQPEKCTSTGI